MNNLIQSKVENSVLHIHLNRFDKKNALTRNMYQTLIKLFSQASQAPDIHAVLIYGNEQCFCAGNDLADFQQAEQQDLIALNFVEKLATFNKPLIAAVAGNAVGIGTTLLLHCDMVLAADNSQFQLPFCRLGLCPEAGSSFLLPQRIGFNLAFELLVLGEPFNADKAQQYQIVNQILPAEQLISTAVQVAEKIAALPFEAVMTSRQLLRQHYQPKLTHVIQNEGNAFKKLLGSKECQTILAQFFNG